MSWPGERMRHACSSRGIMTKKERYYADLAVDSLGAFITTAVAFSGAGEEHQCSEQQAIREFGVTSIPEEAGFILSDGQLLDLSLPNRPGFRWHTHNEIEKIGCRSPVDFMQQQHAIRLSVTSHSVNIEMFNPPTRAQRRAIAWMARDKQAVNVDAYTPYGHHSRTYVMRNPAFIFNDIDRFFTEKIPMEQLKKEMAENVMYSDKELAGMRP